MSHASQIVEVRIRRGGRVGEAPVVIEKAFVGEPATPLTDDEVKAALWDAIDQAIAYLEEQYPEELMGLEEFSEHEDEE